MGFYVELHCDNPECATGSREEGPQGRTRAEVAKEARRIGWVRMNKTWLCRGCVARVKASA